MIQELWQYEFFRNAFYTSILTSVACGMISVYVIVKRISFVSGGIAHCAFGGIGLGYFLGINPLIAVVPFSILSAIGMGYLAHTRKVTEDASIAIFWAVAMAFGVIMIGLTPNYTPDLFRYLFGNILTVPLEDLYLTMILDGLVVFTVFVLYKEFALFVFDEEYAESTGIPVTLLRYILLCLIALTIVILMRVVGIIMVIALLTIPAAIAKMWVRGIKAMMCLSVFLCMIFNVTGLMLSHIFDLASGATIVVVAGAIFGLSLLLKSFLSSNSSYA